MVALTRCASLGTLPCLPSMAISGWRWVSWARLLAIPYGVFAVAWAYVRRACLTLPLQMWYLWRRWYHATDSLGASVASFFASAIMGTAVCDCWNSPDPFYPRAAYHGGDRRHGSG